MAAPFIGLGLKAANPAIENFEKVYDPLKERVKQLPEKVKNMRGQNNRDGYSSEDDYYDRPKHQSSRRDSRRSRDDGRWVEESYERKVSGRARSAGRDRAYGGGGRGLDRERHRRRRYSDSDSSASPPPKDRRRKSLGQQALAVLGIGGGAAAVEHEREGNRDRDRDRERERRRRRDSDRDYARDDYRDDRRDDYRRDDYRPRDGPQQDSRNRYVPAAYLTNGEQKPDTDGTVARRDKGGGSQVSTRNKSQFDEHRGEKRSSSSSSSDAGSSSEDERRVKKARGKEFLTAGLAAVATIHAAQGVYKSMEARDKRHEEVAKGEMSPQEARKLRNKARLQDAAAIAIAGLGIKGAYSEWQEVQEHRHELAEEQKEKERRHEKRLRRAEKASQRNTYARNNSYRSSEPDLNRRYRD